MRKTILWGLVAAVLAGLLIVAPNVLWLTRSSALVRNAGTDALAVRLVISGHPDQPVGAGEVPPGNARFLWLGLHGEATLTVEVDDGTAWRSHCREYVEAGMYRVEIVVRAPDDVTCKTELALTSRLLVRDMLP